MRTYFMHLERSSSHASPIAAALILASLLTGCKGKGAVVDDPPLTAQVQQRIASDSGLANEPVQVMAQAGTVTLTGAVSNNAARSLAADDAANITGVKKVINDITVNPATGPATTTTSTPLVQPAPLPSTTRERVRAAATAPPRTEAPAPVVRTEQQPAPAPVAPPVASQPAAPPPPVVRTVTLPTGTTLPVRVTQTLDSGTAQVGDTFSGAIATDIVQDGMLLIPRGSTVNGRVTEVHEAAHFKGAASLTVELTGVNIKGERLAVSTEPYSTEGKGRGKNTAVKTGVGAAAGAVLGGIFGGGKGAAIGAAAGGGTGAGVNAVTRGQQVQIASESVIRFTTTNSLAVRTSTKARGQGDEPTLQNRDQ